jgi:hypothetical protein
MDKTLFKQKLEPIGVLKRKWAGASKEDEDAWEELVFKLYPKPPTCPDCHTVDYSAKWDGKGNRAGWFKKCHLCRNKTVVKTILDK